MKYLSLFSGIGGFELGIKQSGVDMKCIGYSEVDNFAKSIYTRQFPKHKSWGDATKIDTKELPKFDFLVGGFPCQAFSIAGKRRGFDDTRGTLFFEIARILREKRPKYFLLENVKGLLSHDSGQTFKTMLGVLAQLGYDVEWEVLNSFWFGVPQNRERIFIKGYFRAECGGEILSQKRDCRKVDGRLIKLNNKAQGQSIYDSDGLATTLCGNGGGQGGKTGLYKIKKIGNVSATNHGGENVLDTDGIASTLTSTNYKHLLKIRTNVKKGYVEADKGDGVRLCHPSSKTSRGRVHKERVGALSQSNDWGAVDKDYRIRRLTPKECERLQGFPDEWTKYGSDDEVISDTQRYKCLGNAVTVNVVEYLINSMFGGADV